MLTKKSQCKREEKANTIRIHENQKEKSIENVGITDRNWHKDMTKQNLLLKSIPRRKLRNPNNFQVDTFGLPREAGGSEPLCLVPGARWESWEEIEYRF